MLDGRIAVVIGGTSGIGHAITLGLADAGADVVASSRRQPEVEAAAAEVERRGRRSLRVTSDVTDRASLERLCDETTPEPPTNLRESLRSRLARLVRQV